MIYGIAERDTFVELRRAGISVRARHLRARHLPAATPDDVVRVAYAIPRRVGNAVVRNRVRRRIRGVLDDRRHAQRPLPRGATLFVVDRNVAALDSDDLCREVDDVLDAIAAKAMTP